MSHQDWQTIVFRKPKTKTQISSQNSAQTLTASTSRPAWKVEKMVDGDFGKPIDWVTKEEGMAIMRGRLASKLTQVQLAAKLNNVQAKEIQEIESGKAVRNNELLARIRRVLGIKKSG